MVGNPEFQESVCRMPLSRSLTVAFSVLFVMTGAACMAQGATMFRGDAAHTGVYPATAGRSYAGMQWRFQTEGAVRSSPAYSGGTIYVGSSDHHLYAIDARSGALRWKFDAGTPISSSPGVENGIVYFEGYDNTIFALDAATGGLRWKNATGPNVPLPWGYESGDFWNSSPVLTGSMLLIGSGDSFLYALDASSGAVLWRSKTDGRVRSTPAVWGNTVFVGSYDGYMHAYDLSDGKSKWSFATEGVNLKSGAFGYDRRSVQSSPAVANNGVFFGSRDGSIYAVDASTGLRRWRVTADVYWYLSSPAIDRGLVMTGNSDARFIQAIDAETGKVSWSLNTDINVFASPSSSGGVAYTGDWDGVMHATDEKSGKDLWTFRATGRRIFSSVTVADDRLFFGSDDGGIYALNLTPKPALRRAVYYDEKYEKRAFLSAPRTMKNYFSKRAYTVLDGAALADFMKARIADEAPSVVVFAIDDLPPEITGPDGGIFKRYLERDGKVVWVGVPPALWPFDIKAGERDLSGLNRGNAKRLLGVSFEPGNFDPLTIVSTDAGKRWGMLGSSLGPWAADSGSVTDVLGEDEQGHAGAFVKRYHGPPGSGYVQIPLAMSADMFPLNLLSIQTAAEYFPR